MKIINELMQHFNTNLFKNSDVLEYLVVYRKLKKELLEKFCVGFGDKTPIEHDKIGTFDGYIIFPVVDNGTLVNVYARIFKENDKQPKHLITASKTTVYNPDALKEESVVIVESPIDALTLLGMGINVCATFGANLKSSLVPLFRNKQVYIMFDNDDAGKTGTTQAMHKLMGVAGNIYLVRWPTDYKKSDPNSFAMEIEAAKSRIKFLLENSVPVSNSHIQRHPYKARGVVDEEDRVDIVMVAKKLLNGVDYIEQNGSLWVKCPKHSEGRETKRSLWIGGSKNIFNCFGCCFGGGPIRFVSWWLNISAKEARQYIKDHYINN